MAPGSRRVAMIEKTGRSEETFLAHLPLEGPLRQVGVGLAARAAGEARILDVFFHQRCTPQRSASGWRAGAARGKAAIALRHQAHIGHRRRLTDAKGAARAFLAQQFLEGAHPTADPVAQPVLERRLIEPQLALQVARHALVLQWLYIGDEDLRQGARACAQARRARQERGLRMRLLEPLDDRHRLRQHAVRALQRRNARLRVERAIGRTELLATALEQVHGNVLVTQALQFERDAHAVGSGTAPVIVEAQRAHTTPRRIWSSSIDSNRALKLPSPKPSLPLRWMISKKIGPITLAVKICSKMPSLADPSIRMPRRFSSASFSWWPETRASTPS